MVATLVVAIHEREYQAQKVEIERYEPKTYWDSVIAACMNGGKFTWHDELTGWYRVTYCETINLHKERM